MELFIACMALIFHLSHNPDHNQNEDVLPPLESKINPGKWLTRATCFFCTAMIFVLFYMIHMAPVLYVYPLNIDHRLQRVFIRLGTHICNLIIACLGCIVFEIPRKNLKTFFKKADADIIILKVAFGLHCIIFVCKLILECIYLVRTLNTTDIWLYGFAQFSNFIEIISFFVLIFLAERLLLIATCKSENLDNYECGFTVLFVLIYSCITLLGFIAYYNLKALHQFPRGVQAGRGLNLLVLFQSTYPSTLLFTLTLGLCFASAGEKFFKKGFYRFTPSGVLRGYESVATSLT